MKKSCLLSLCCIISSLGMAQTQGLSGLHHFPLKGRILMSALPERDVEIQTLEEFNAPFRRIDGLKPQPAPDPISKAGLTKKASAPDPMVLAGFTAQAPSGTPLDNNLAISKAGLLVSAVNTTFRVTDSTGTFLFSRSLAAIANELGSLTRTFDPHVFYDFERDRFILVFLNGSDHTNTNVIVGFSETNDPRGAWNFYAIPGNTSSNDWWSDYPFIGISNNALYISVQLWMDNETGWDIDASDENIWQVDLEKGFAGDSLRVKQYHSLNIGGKQIWNTRPVSGAIESYGPDFYLIANRPKDASNDTLFLIHIQGNWDTLGNDLTIRVIKADQPYGLQPNVTQKGGRRLRTNYCDIQNAYYLNGNIYFCSNSIDFSTGRPGVFVGKISDVAGTMPMASAQIFGVDSLDLNYPSIAYSGAGWPDESAMVMCLHNSQNSYPGTSAFSLGRDWTFSNLVRLKEGEGAMNILFGDSLERWGDYTGIQRDYGKTGRVWIAGSFGKANGTSQTWIAAVGNSDPQLGFETIPSLPYTLYPNPGKLIYLNFELFMDMEVEVSLIDAQGKSLFIQKQNLIAGKQKLRLNTGEVPGVYFLLVKDDKGRELIREKVLVSH
ncbi:MAG: T9SS type A sorting domain-containing protein [Bacteroidia bacterium]